MGMLLPWEVGYKARAGIVVVEDKADMVEAEDLVDEVRIQLGCYSAAPNMAVVLMDNWYSSCIKF